MLIAYLLLHALFTSLVPPVESAYARPISWQSVHLEISRNFSIGYSGATVPVDSPWLTPDWTLVGRPQSFSSSFGSNVALSSNRLGGSSSDWSDNGTSANTVAALPSATRIWSGWSFRSSSLTTSSGSRSDSLAASYSDSSPRLFMSFSHVISGSLGSSGGTFAVAVGSAGSGSSSGDGSGNVGGGTGAGDGGGISVGTGNGGPILGGGTGGPTPTPEPASLTWISVISLALLRRRHRSN